MNLGSIKNYNLTTDSLSLKPVMDMVASMDTGVKTFKFPMSYSYQERKAGWIN